LKRLFLLVFPILLFWGCSENPTEIGDAFIDKNIDYFADTLSAVASSSFIFDMNTNVSKVLFIGKYENINDASMLIKFTMPSVDSIAARTKKIKILKAEISLYPLYFIGNKNFNFEIKEISKFWDYTANNSVIKQQVNAYLSQNILKNQKVTDTLLSLEIDTHVVRNWLESVLYDTTKRNYGIKISSNSNGSIVAIRGYAPYTYSKIPAIKVTYFDIEKNKEFTITLNSTVDLSIFEGNFPFYDNSKYTVAQGSLAIASKVLFDLPQNFKKSVVNKARISFEVDTILSTKNFADSVYVTLLSSADLNLTYGRSYYIFKSSRKGFYEGDIVPLMQAIANEYVGNYGLKITYGRDINSIDKIYFKKNSFRLILGYTQLKK
jgi:hypothetical protein